MRTRLLSSVFAFLLLAIPSPLSLAQQNPGAPPRPTEPEPLTILPGSVLDAELKSASGHSFRLSDYSGKVLVVNLWATWLTPSRLEIPALVKLHKEFRARGVEIVGLSTESPDMSGDGVRRWVRRYGVHYRVGWVTTSVAITLLHGRDALPQTYVIAGSGRIVRRFVGFNATRTPLQFKKAIEEALKEDLDPAKQD